MKIRSGSTRAWRRLRTRILAASDICGICGHPGSDAIDHITPVARGGTNEPHNLQPAHHVKPCATCGEKCNRVKSDRQWAPIVRSSGSIQVPRGATPPPPPTGPFPA